MLRELIKNRIHVIFGVLALLLVISGFVNGYLQADRTLDINVHDTYFIIAHFHLYITGVIWLLGCSFLYWLCTYFQIPLNFVGRIFHLLLTLI